MTLVRQIENEVKSDIRTARKYHLPWWAMLAIIIGTVLVASLFDYFGKLNLALPALNSILVLSFIIFLKRKFWQKRWFWLTMTIVATLNVLLLPYVPWGEKWVPAIAIAGVNIIGFFAILAILALVERFAEGRIVKTHGRRRPPQ